MSSEEQKAFRIPKQVHRYCLLKGEPTQPAVTASNPQSSPHHLFSTQNSLIHDQRSRHTHCCSAAHALPFPIVFLPPPHWHITGHPPITGPTRRCSPLSSFAITPQMRRTEEILAELQPGAGAGHRAGHAPAPANVHPAQ